jgi:hypothetical protein
LIVVSEIELIQQTYKTTISFMYNNDHRNIIDNLIFLKSARGLAIADSGSSKAQTPAS